MKIKLALVTASLILCIGTIGNAFSDATRSKVAEMIVKALGVV
ncbi:hypothetical protein [Andreesenia angusta]|nr:hypothetical protein [Andreesenia angusta]